VLDAARIVEGLLRGAMGGRRKSWRKAGRAARRGGLLDARTLLAAAGVAWGLYETWQRQQGQRAAAPGGPPPAADSPGAPPPVEDGLPASVLQLARLMISAAGADGEIGAAERERILAEAREVGAEAVVRRELESPRPLGEIVAGVADPELKERLYALAFTIVRLDEEVTGAERIYLAQLAHRLALDPATVARAEAEVAARIEAESAEADGRA
jgi:uncharacterized membrane protein YebE (DUF533 family)